MRYANRILLVAAVTGLIIAALTLGLLMMIGIAAPSAGQLMPFSAIIFGGGAVCLACGVGLRRRGDRHTGLVLIVIGALPLLAGGMLLQEGVSEKLQYARIAADGRAERAAAAAEAVRQN